MTNKTFSCLRKSDGFTVNMPADQWHGYGDQERAEWEPLEKVPAKTVQPKADKKDDE
jgi:hypothetical protein